MALNERKLGIVASDIRMDDGRTLTRANTLAAQAFEQLAPVVGRDVSDYIREAAEAGRRVGVALPPGRWVKKRRWFSFWKRTWVFEEPR